MYTIQISVLKKLNKLTCYHCYQNNSITIKTTMYTDVQLHHNNLNVSTHCDSYFVGIPTIVSIINY